MKNELSLLERFVEYLNIDAEKDFSVEGFCTITDENGDKIVIFNMLGRLFVTINSEQYGMFEESKYLDHATGKYVDYFKQVFE